MNPKEYFDKWYIGKLVRVSGSVVVGSQKTSTRTQGRGRVIREDQSRLDLTFTADGLDAIIVSVFLKKEDTELALGLCGKLPSKPFRLDAILTNGDSLRIIQSDRSQETFRLYPVFSTEFSLSKRP
jgi:hypothetical protein